MKLITANIKSRPRMRIRKVIADYANVFSRRPDIVGFQEISPRDYKRNLASEASLAGYDVVRGGPRSAIPIAYAPKKFLLIASRLITTHRGHYGIVPRRMINMTTLLDRETLEIVVVLNTHLVPGKNNPRATFRKWRIASWHKHMEMLIDLVEELKAKKTPNGTPFKIVVMGDFNEDRLQRFFNELGKPKARTRIDYVYTNFGRARNKVVIELNSDHDALEIQV